MVLKMIQNTKRKERNMIFSDFYDKDMKKTKTKTKCRVDLELL